MEKTVGQGVHFERIRRITGYLVGGLDRFNDAKRAEEKDRVKHVKIKDVRIQLADEQVTGDIFQKERPGLLPGLMYYGG